MSLSSELKVKSSSWPSHYPFRPIARRNPRPMNISLVSTNRCLECNVWFVSICISIAKVVIIFHCKTSIAVVNFPLSDHSTEIDNIQTNSRERKETPKIHHSDRMNPHQPPIDVTQCRVMHIVCMSLLLAQLMRNKRGKTRYIILWRKKIYYN